MKKVPKWTREVLYFSQEFPCADTRNGLLGSLISGEFDYYGEYQDMVRNYCFSEDMTHGADTFGNEWEAIESGRPYIRMATLIHEWKAKNY